MNDMIEKYNKLLETFEIIILNTKNEGLKETAKNSYIFYIIELAKLEKKDISIYETKMNNINLNPETIENAINKINSTNQIIEQKEEKILEEDNKETNNNEIGQEENEEVLSTPAKPLVEESKENSIKELEEYIFMNVYRNKNQTIGDEHQKLVLKLQKDLKNPNDELIKTWVKNYIEFINRYKEELNKDKLIEYMYTLFEKYDVHNKYKDSIKEIVKEIEETKVDNNIEKNKEEIKDKDSKQETTKTIKEEEPLKIVNVKPSYNSKAKNIALGTVALMGIGGLFSAGLGIPAIIISAIIAALYKKGITNNKLQNYLKEHNFAIDPESKELIDSNGEKVTKTKVEKEKYGMLKNYLMKLNPKKTGAIKHEYKKNKITSNLLGSKLVNKLKVIKVRKATNEDTLENNVEIQKGMGKC